MNNAEEKGLKKRKKKIGLRPLAKWINSIRMLYYPSKEENCVGKGSRAH